MPGIKDFFGRVINKAKSALDRFAAFKEAHPRFKKFWNFVTHPTVTRIVGLVVSIGLAPVTGGFTLLTTAYIGLSALTAFTSTIVKGYLLNRLRRAEQKKDIVTRIAEIRKKLDKLTGPPAKAWEEIAADWAKVRGAPRQTADAKPAHPLVETINKYSPAVLRATAGDFIYSFAGVAATIGVGAGLTFASILASNVVSILGETADRLKITLKGAQVRADIAEQARKAEVDPSKSITQLTEILRQHEAASHVLTAPNHQSSRPDEIMGAYHTRLHGPEQSQVMVAARSPGLLRSIWDSFNPLGKDPLEDPRPHDTAHAETPQGAPREAPAADAKVTPDAVIAPQPKPRVVMNHEMNHDTAAPTAPEATPQVPSSTAQRPGRRAAMRDTAT